MKQKEKQMDYQIKTEGKQYQIMHNGEVIAICFDANVAQDFCARMNNNDKPDKNEHTAGSAL